MPSRPRARRPICQRCRRRREPSARSVNAAQRARELLTKADDLARLTAWEGAIDYYQRALKVLPDNHQARYQLAACFDGTRDIKRAAESYRQVANARNVPSELAQAAASRLKTILTPALTPEQEESYDLAVAFLRRGERPSEASTRPFKEAALDREVLGVAIKRFETFAAKVPEFTPLYANLGIAHELNGENEAAAGVYGEYLRRFGALGIPLGPRERDIRTRRALLLDAVLIEKNPPAWRGRGSRSEQAVGRGGFTECSRHYQPG